MINFLLGILQYLKKYNVIKKDILGSETLKTLNTATYEIINTIDGISQNR